MKQTNLITLLQSFSVYELNKLRKYIISPYFNSSKRIINLFEALRSDILKNKLSSKEKYYQNAYPKHQFNDQKFRNLNSDLFQLTLKFIAQEEYEKDFQEQANNLIASVKEREVKAIYDKAISTSHKWMDKIKIEDGNTFLQKFNLEKNIFNLTSEFEKKTTIKKSESDITVLKINDNLDFFYMIEKLKYYNSYLSWKRLIKSDYEFPYIDRVLAIVRTHKHGLPPALQIYYEIYKTLTNQDDIESYEKLKALTKQYQHLFTQQDVKEIYESMTNFTINQINNGNEDFYEELLQTYSSGIASGAMLQNGFLSPTSFRNICALGLRMKRFEWVEEFITERLDLLEPEYQSNAFKFNMARVHFYKKNHKQVIETVREVDFVDPLYAHVSKSMILISYYELFDEEALIYFADSFSTYMRRSKSSSEKKRKDYLNFIKYIKQLNKARYNPELLPKIKSDIINATNIASKPWFLEKLANIKLPNEE